MKTAAALLLLLAALTLAPVVSAQGCSQCREALGQTPARTQAAYRRGIIVLICAAGVVFSGTVFLLRWFR